MNKFERINEITIQYVKEKKVFGIGIVYDDTKRIVVPADDIKHVCKQITKLTRELEYNNKQYEEQSKK